MSPSDISLSIFSVVMEKRFPVLVLAILVVLFAAASSEDDLCSTLPQGIPCSHMARCGGSQLSKIAGNFYLNNKPAGTYETPNYETYVEGCYDDAGFYFEMFAWATKHVFNPTYTCNAPVYLNGDVLETFIAPVKNIADVPMWYWEVDGGANANLFAGTFKNTTQGNVDNCPSCVAGLLPCTGNATFPPHNFAINVTIHRLGSPNEDEEGRASKSSRFASPSGEEIELPVDVASAVPSLVSHIAPKPSPATSSLRKNLYSHRMPASALAASTIERRLGTHAFGKALRGENPVPSYWFMRLRIPFSIFPAEMRNSRFFRTNFYRIGMLYFFS